MNKIGICGGGLIGASWALGFSSNKYKVFVYDNSKKVREEFLNTVKSLYEDLSILKDISFNEIESNIVICESIEETCKDATLIQESIIENLEEKINLLLKRFDEQKGIIDSYVKREREWKKDKVLHRKEISRLERDLKKATNE